MNQLWWAKRITPLLVYFIAAFSCNYLCADSDRISSDVLYRARYYAEKLYRTYPPEKYFIINFGATSAIASAHFRNKIPDPVMQADYFRELMVRNITDIRIESDWSVLKALFDRLLPSDEILRGRPVVFHRILWEGMTFYKFSIALAKYRKLYRPGLKIGAFIIRGASISSDFEDKPIQFGPYFEHVDTAFSKAIAAYLNFEKNGANGRPLYAFSGIKPVSFFTLNSDTVDAAFLPNLSRAELGSFLCSEHFDSLWLP